MSECPFHMKKRSMVTLQPLWITVVELFRLLCVTCTLAVTLHWNRHGNCTALMKIQYHWISFSSLYSSRAPVKNCFAALVMQLNINSNLVGVPLNPSLLPHCASPTPPPLKVWTDFKTQATMKKKLEKWWNNVFFFRVKNKWQTQHRC